MPPTKKRGATGGGSGSKADMERLSRELGISKAAVEAMLAAQGAGLVPQASSRTRSRLSGAEKKSTPAPTSAGANAWSDFMNDDDSPAKKKSTPSSNVSDANKTDMPAAKKAKANDSAATVMTKKDDSAADGATKKVVTHKQYHLPVKASVDIEGVSAQKVGVLLQTGTLDAKIPGRKNLAVAHGPRPCDLWQPTLLCLNSIFNKISIAFVAASSSACHTVALTSTGMAYGWGRNEENQLGLGYHSDSVFVPKLLSSVKGNAGALQKGGSDEGDGGSDNGVGEHNPIVTAAVGKSHTVLVDENGAVYAAGQNKLGQCGVNTTLEYILHFKRCVLVDSTVGKSQQSSKDAAASDKKKGRGRQSKGGNDTSALSAAAGGSAVISTVTDPTSIQVVQVACGESTTMALSREGYLYSTGSAEFGQLGNGDPGEYIVTAGKTAFADDKVFQRRAMFVTVEEEHNSSSRMEDRAPLPDSYEIRLSSIACGKYHSVAVEAPFDAPPPVDRQDFRHVRRVFSWGAGNYGCLGHRIQADEHYPRLMDTLTGPLLSSNQPHTAACGTQCSMVLTTQGHVYYSGKHKVAGEATMRPTVLDFLANNGHVVQTCGGGNGTVVCGTTNGSTVSWGQGPYGELGYGAEGAKSSAKPKFVEGLDKCILTQVGCGYAHACFVVLNEDAEDKALIAKLPRVEVQDLQDLEDAVAQKKGVSVGHGPGSKKGKK
jgi:alpha-tubulin suppressor-like RCC1 family protein